MPLTERQLANLKRIMDARVRNNPRGFLDALRGDAASRSVAAASDEPASEPVNDEKLKEVLGKVLDVVHRFRETSKELLERKFEEAWPMVATSVAMEDLDEDMRQLIDCDLSGMTDQQFDEFLSQPITRILTDDEIAKIPVGGRDLDACDPANEFDSLLAVESASVEDLKATLKPGDILQEHKYRHWVTVHANGGFTLVRGGQEKYWTRTSR